MRFDDLSTRLLIKGIESTDNNEPPSFEFKSYLEKSDVQVKLLDSNIQYAPLNFTNNTQLLKTQYSVDFSFNVFSEDREEAFDNYDQLHKLLYLLKPSYTQIGNQLLPKSSNIFGIITLQFDGLPRISKTVKELTIYVNNFSYEVNKETGYIHAPYNPIVLQGTGEQQQKIQEEKINRQNFYTQGQMSLVPVAYKLNISGKVLLSLDESINKNTITYDPVKPVEAPNEPVVKDTQTSQTTPSQPDAPPPATPTQKPANSQNKCTNDQALNRIPVVLPATKNAILAIANKFVGENKINKLSCSKKQSVFKIIYNAIYTDFLMDSSGSPAKKNGDGVSYEGTPYAPDYYQTQLVPKYNKLVDQIKKTAGAK
jgi:hypothetical protein